MTNLLLFLGLILPLRPLLVPWLAAHVLLCLALTAASLYYLVLYVETDCVDEDGGGSGDRACTQMLGYAVSLIGAVCVLAYCIYIVQDFFDILKYEIRRERSQQVKS